MKKRSFYLIIVLMLMLVSACDDGDNKDDKKVISTTVFTLPKEYLRRPVLGPEKQLYVINSINELEELINTLEDIHPPKVDFEKNTLLLVQGWITSGISEIHHKLTLDTKSNYLLEIEIHRNITSVIGEYQIALLTNKILSSSKVLLDVIVIS